MGEGKEGKQPVGMGDGQTDLADGRAPHSLQLADTHTPTLCCSSLTATIRLLKVA